MNVTTRRNFFSNLIALYGVQFATLIVPVATLPYLSRTLGPAAWGQLAAVQALSLTLSLIVEYGFVFSATRKVAQNRDDSLELAQIAAGVLGAKLLLSIVVVILGCLIFYFVQGFNGSPHLLLWGIIYAIVQGFSPLWYFQGMEKLQLSATIDTVARVMAASLVFIFVTSPEDAWRVVAFQVFSLTLAQLINSFRMYNEIRFLWPSVAASISGLRDGASMFLFRISVGIYTTANAALLRLFVPSTQVSYYANADRLATAGKSMVQPVTQLLFPRVSSLIRSDIMLARRVLKKTFIVLIATSLTVTTMAILIAPYFIPWFFGASYSSTISLFQLLSLTFPIVATSNILGIQWMIPNGMDRAFNTIIVLTGIVDIIFLVLLVPHFGAKGMVLTVIITECFVAAAMFFYLQLNGNNPLSSNVKYGIRAVEYPESGKR